MSSKTESFNENAQRAMIAEKKVMMKELDLVKMPSSSELMIYMRLKLRSQRKQLKKMDSDDIGPN